MARDAVVFGGKTLCYSLPPNPEAIFPMRGSQRMKKRVGLEGWDVFSIARR